LQHVQTIGHIRRALATTTLALACLVGTAAVAQARVLPSTTSGVHQFTGLQGRSGHHFTSAELHAIGSQSDIVSGLAVQIRSYGPALRSANRHVRLFVYLNGMFSQAKQAGTFPKSWYLHDSHGNRIRSQRFANYLMNPYSRTRFHGSRGWASWVAHRCAAKIKQSRLAQGCFLDQMSSAGNTGFVSSLPIDPKTGRHFTMKQFMSAVNIVGNAAAARAPIIGNSYESGVRYYQNDTRRVNRSAMRAFEAEHWLGATQPRDAETLSKWQKSVQMLIGAQRHGKGVLVNFGDMSTNLSSWQTFVVSSMLLGNNGRVWVHFDSSAAGGPASWQLNTAVMRAPIGHPLVTHRKVSGYLHGGVYRRAFSNGVVIVNPTATTRSLAFSHTYSTLSAQRVARISLKPFTGMVLLG
jgi:hypothetical protein